METRKLGSSDLYITPVILGTWALGGSNWGDYNKDAAIKTIEKALDLGINTIDTAPAYNRGQAESLIGDIIKGERERYIIATKCGLNFNKKPFNDLSPEFIREDLHNSLQRLQTDFIDLYQCHWPDTHTPLEETMKALAALQEEGKIRYIGLSNYTKDDIEHAMQYGKIVSLQPQYSLLKRNIEEELVPFCADNSVGILSYGSLGGGLLTGKYSEPPRFNGSDARSFFYTFFKSQYWPKVSAVINYLKEIAEQNDTKPSNIALAWNIAQKGISAAIVGAKTEKQIEENAASVRVRLTQEQVDRLNNLSDYFIKELPK